MSILLAAAVARKQSHLYEIFSRKSRYIGLCMLLRFSVDNFRSIRDRQELSLVAASRLTGGSAPVPSKNADAGVLTVAAVYGANASGKSNVHAALSFMETAVLDSHRTWEADKPIPVTPFLLHQETRERPSTFSVDIQIDEVRYEYGFALDRLRVHREWLYAYPRGRRQVWFERDAASPMPFRFGKHLVGENRTIVGITRENSLYVSAAAQTNHEQLRMIYRWFLLGMRRISNFRYPGSTKRRCLDAAFKQRLQPFLKAADVGVVGIEAVENVPQPPSPELLETMAALLRIMNPESEPPTPRNEAPEPTVEVSLRHQGDVDDGVALPFDDESAGTIAWFSLLGPVLDAIDRGSLLLVDELDVSLHTLLSAEIIKLFSDRKRNSLNAQLVFTSHDTNLLSGLRRDEVWFVEKDGTGATHLYPLTDFKPRADERIEKGYLQGRYGAIPFIGELLAQPEPSAG